MCLHLCYIRTDENSADEPSRRLSSMHCLLTEDVWQSIQNAFGGPGDHTFDLMALYLNAIKDESGNSLPHFTPGSSGVNLFAQDLTRQGPAMRRSYVFTWLILVGPVLRFLESYKQPCTIVILDVYLRKYW